MAEIKSGDRVVRKKDNCCSAIQGREYTVVVSGGALAIGDDPSNQCGCVAEWTLITQSSNNMNLLDKMRLAFKGEPEKSFIKAGVMNSDETLTSDGRELFLQYLLKKNGDDFKATVVDPILAEEDAKTAK